MFIVGSGFLVISIQLCSLQNYRTKLPKPPEYPLDIPRYAMNPHDKLTHSLKHCWTASSLQISYLIHSLQVTTESESETERALLLCHCQRHLAGLAGGIVGRRRASNSSWHFILSILHIEDTIEYNLNTNRSHAVFKVMSTSTRFLRYEYKRRQVLMSWNTVQNAAFFSTILNKYISVYSRDLLPGSFFVRHLSELSDQLDVTLESSKTVKMALI
jgi:hypothetical protein